MRNLNIIFLSFVILLFAAGCTSRDPERYYSEEYSFSIKFPASWKLKEGYMGSIVRAENPHIGPDDLFQENINIITDTLPSDMTMDVYFESGRKMLIEALPGLKIEGNAMMKINGYQTAVFSYSYPLKPALMKAVVYNIIIKKKIYIITCTADSEKFLTLKDTFDKAARSFRVE